MFFQCWTRFCRLGLVGLFDCAVAPFRQTAIGLANEAQMVIDKLQYSDQDVNKENGKYSLNVICGADADLSELKNAIKAAAKAKFGDKAQALAKAGKLKLPIRKGDTYTDDTGTLYNGYHEDDQVVPISFYNPMIFLDQFKNKIESDSKQAQTTFYPGCEVTAAVTAHGFDTAGSKGVRLQLYALMKTDEGEQLGGSAAGDPDEVFADVKAKKGSPVDDAPAPGGDSVDDGDDW